MSILLLKLEQSEKDLCLTCLARFNFIMQKEFSAKAILPQKHHSSKTRCSPNRPHLHLAETTIL
eukprot:c32057_g1_i1 orf=3-191(-)